MSNGEKEFEEEVRGNAGRFALCHIPKSFFAQF